MHFPFPKNRRVYLFKAEGVEIKVEYPQFGDYKPKKFDLYLWTCFQKRVYKKLVNGKVYTLESHFRPRPVYPGEDESIQSDVIRRSEQFNIVDVAAFLNNPDFDKLVEVIRSKDLEKTWLEIGVVERYLPQPFANVYMINGKLYDTRVAALDKIAPALGEHFREDHRNPFFEETFSFRMINAIFNDCRHVIAEIYMKEIVWPGLKKNPNSGVTYPYIDRR